MIFLILKKPTQKFKAWPFRFLKKDTHQQESLGVQHGTMYCHMVSQSNKRYSNSMMEELRLQNIYPNHSFSAKDPKNLKVKIRCAITLSTLLIILLID